MADEKDIAQAALASLSMKPGQRYRHFKGGEYEIITLALQENTMEPLVIYRSKLKNTVWARTVQNFTEQVDRDGYKGPRFVHFGG